MAERRLHGLQRVLGTNALFATAYGNVGSSIYYALGLVASYALGLTPVVFVITGVFFFMTAASYAEATAMFPEAGGSSSFARRAFNEFASFFAAWTGMLTYTLTVAISAFFVPHYIGGLFWDYLRHSPGDIFGGTFVVAVLVALNVRGTEESTSVNVLLAVVDFATQILLVVLGLFVVFSPHTLIANVDLGTVPTWSQFALAVPIGMLAYTGIETISNMAEEAKDETTTIPKAINRVRLAVFAIYLFLPSVALSALPVRVAHAGEPAVTTGAVHVGEKFTYLGLTEQHGGSAGDPVLGLVRAMDLGALQHLVEIYVGLLAATILFLATNAGLIGVSRLVYSMGIHRQMPDALRRLHPKYQTPWIGLVLFGGLAILALLPGKADFLGGLYSFGALMSFTIAHVSVARLRATKPEQPRPYRGPGNLRIGDYDAPMFAIIGGAFTFVAFVVVSVLNPTVAAAGLGWLVLGVMIYVPFRRSLGLDLTSTHKVAIPQPVVDHEAEYDSVLIALNAEEGYNAGIVATAIKLAVRRRRGIHVLVTIPVPYALELRAPMRDEESRADSIIEQARVAGGRRVTGHWEKVRPGQAGRRIIEEAEDMRASAIVMGLPRRIAGSSLFGKTLETVLADRPCRVVIESAPETAVQRGAYHAALRAEAAG